MKKLCLLIVVMFCFSLSQAQDNGRRERIKTLKIAFITDKLSLTKVEAEQFWPIYNRFDEEHDELRREMRSDRKGLDVDNMSEKNARAMVEDYLVKEKKKLQLKEAYMKELLKVLPAKKIIQLKVAEDEFNRRMFEEYRKRKKNDRNPEN